MDDFPLPCQITGVLEAKKPGLQVRTSMTTLIAFFVSSGSCGVTCLTKKMFEWLHNWLPELWSTICDFLTLVLWLLFSPLIALWLGCSISVGHTTNHNKCYWTIPTFTPFARIIRPLKGRFAEPQTVGKKCIQGSSFDTSDSVSSWDWGARVDLDWSIQVTLEMPSLPLVTVISPASLHDFSQDLGVGFDLYVHPFHFFLRSCFPILSLFPTNISLFESLTCFPMIFTFCSAVLSLCKGLTPTCCNCPQLLPEFICWRTEWTTSFSNLSPIVPEIVSSTFSENPSF